MDANEPAPVRSISPSEAVREVLKTLLWALLMGSILGGGSAAIITAVSQLAIPAVSAIPVLVAIATLFGAIVGGLIAIPASLGTSLVVWIVMRTAIRQLAVWAGGITAGLLASAALLILKDFARITFSPWFILGVGFAAGVIACLRITYKFGPRRTLPAT